MTKEQRNDIKADIKRSIAHIARTHNISEEEVSSILIDDFNDEDDFTIIQWPDIQAFMDIEGFNTNACLANDNYFLDIYGSSAYFVNKNWLNKIS